MIELSFESIHVSGALAIVAALLGAWAEFGKGRADILVIRVVGYAAFFVAMAALFSQEARALLNGILFAGFLLVAFLGGVPGVEMHKPPRSRYRRATLIFLIGSVFATAATFVAILRTPV